MQHASVIDVGGTSEVPDETTARARGVATRVLVLSENRLFREGLVRLLADHPAFVVIGSHSGAGDLDEAREIGFHVALVDVARPPGLSVIASVRAFEQRIPVIAVGVPMMEAVIVGCAEAGVSGYVLADGDLEDVVDAVASALRGEVHCPPIIASTLARRFASLAASRTEVPETRLSRREQEILDLMDQGLANKAIATQLMISISTVKNHAHNIYAKLGVQSRHAASATLRDRP